MKKNDSQIKIVSGKRGWHLCIGGMYINHSFNGEVRAIQNECGIPYGATEWVSIKAIREFWAKYMTCTVHALKKPYESVWGQLNFKEINHE